MVQKINLIFILPFLFFFSCCEIGSDRDLLEDFVFVKGTTITGAITAQGYTESTIFKAGSTVTIEDFYICNHEVTQAEFAKYYEGYKNRIEENEKGIGPRYPAYDVNWFDSLIYCNNRSIAEDLTPCYSINGKTNPSDWGKVPKGSSWTTWNDWLNAKCDFNANGYRLPTTIEWEYAARGGNGLAGYQYKYAGSDNLDEVAVWNASLMSEIKTKKPNTLGIYDMNGNVDEWCWDRYGGDSYRLYCGGYYYFKDEKSYLLSKAPSLGHNIVIRNSQLGLRVVRSAK